MISFLFSGSVRAILNFYCLIPVGSSNGVTPSTAKHLPSPTNMRMTRLLVHGIFIFLFQVLAASFAYATQCYYPDKRMANDWPCNGNDSGMPGPCCARGDMCLSNHLCQNPSTRKIIRGSCTDQNWGPGCPNFCKNEANSGGLDLIQCDSGSVELYCCGGDADCCNTPDKPFEVLPLSPTTSATWYVSASQFVAVALISSSFTSSSIQSSTVPSSPYGSGDGTSQPHKGASGLNTAAWAGIGVGVGLGAILLAAIVFFALRRRKKAMAARWLQSSRLKPGQRDRGDIIRETPLK